MQLTVAQQNLEAPAGAVEAAAHAALRRSSAPRTILQPRRVHAPREREKNISAQAARIGEVAATSRVPCY